MDILPIELQDIIFNYLHQLKYKDVMNELKLSIEYKYFSSNFSEISYFSLTQIFYPNRIISYYSSNGNQRLLIMYKNYNHNDNTFILIKNYN